MGIDSEDVITIGDNLLERYPDAFSDDFETNRRKVKQLTELQSQHVCNRVAGYITRSSPEGLD